MSHKFTRLSKYGTKYGTNVSVKLLFFFCIAAVSTLVGCKSRLRNHHCGSNEGGSVFTQGNSKLQVGGSNYVMFDVDRYMSNPTEENWYRKDVLKPVIGSYHLNPMAVSQQLQMMCDAGQRKIALVLWYMPISRNNIATTDVYGHTVDSSGGRMSNSHQANLRNLLNNIYSTKQMSNGKQCFNELQFRFAGQGHSDPGGWPSWDEAQYQENWNFILNTREIVENSLINTNLKRFYDLNVEAGGLTHGQMRPYVKRLWQDYTYTFGPKDTYGFSIALEPGRVAELIRTYRETNVLPSSYAFDVYDNIPSRLKSAISELNMEGQVSKTILIQETYYNDKKTANDLMEIVNETGINLRTIMQWPIHRNSEIPHFSMNFPLDYLSYKSLEESEMQSPTNSTVIGCSGDGEANIANNGQVD